MLIVVRFVSFFSGYVCFVLLVGARGGGGGGGGGGGAGGGGGVNLVTRLLLQLAGMRYSWNGWVMGWLNW